MEAKKGETSPSLDNKGRVTQGEGEHAPEIKTQGNLRDEGTFHPSKQDKRNLPPPEKDASFRDRRAPTGHPGGEEELAPPDGGWGWLVAFGAFVITSLLPLLGPCFGILFSRYLLELGTSSTTTAWIFNTQCFIWNLFGLVARPFTQEFGWRRVALLGAFLTSLSLVVSAFAPSAEFLFFSYSLLSGAGGGAAVCICFTIVPLYFERRRGQANAIMMAGVCLGQIIGPPLVNFLQAEFGFKGATIIMGAILLNACVGASLFHPIAWHQKRVTRSRITGLQEGTEEPLVPSEALDTNSPMLAVRKGLVRVRNHSIASLGGSSLGLSTIDLPGLAALASAAEDDDGDASSTSSRNSGTICNILLILQRVWCSTVSDLRALRSPRALIIAVGGTLCINGYLNFVMMVPFAMQAGGYTLQDSAFCISISAVCNLLLRMIVSTLSDWPKFSVRACYMAGFGLISATMFVFPLLSDLRWMMVVMGAWGCGVGANMGLYNLVMIKVMGIDRLPSVFGSCCFMVAIGFILFGPLIGVVRDVSGSYSISMWVLATMVLLSLCLWVLMPAAKERGADEAAPGLAKKP
ncbi:monocarboxylate transporter 14-like [Penaeus indicus]|uniref:monocarboxylate transporter 14-like n=1 Tax=Penaeus indicus TaxID=29960 RepID=UPI00300C68BD